MLYNQKGKDRIEVPTIAIFLTTAEEKGMISKTMYLIFLDYVRILVSRIPIREIDEISA